MEKEQQQQLGSYYEQYATKLNRYLARSVFSLEEREDVVQEAFTRATEHFDQYNPDRGKFFSWLLTIAYHYYSDEGRKKLAHPTAELTEDNFLPDPLPTPEQAYLTHEMQTDVRAAIDTLPPRHKNVILYQYLEEHTSKETGQDLNMPKGSVKSVAHRGREIMKPLLKDYGKNNL